MRIAIVGSGISGLTCAHVLSPHHQITLFEAGTYLGGHTHTIAVEDPSGRRLDIDTGFIVFNDWTYPNFIRLLDQLGVASKPSSMGFSVSCLRTGVEYNSGSLSGLFAAPGNLLRPDHYRMLAEILRFFRRARSFLRAPDESLSLEGFIRAGGYSSAFSERFLVPMMSAIWSAGPDTVRTFPAAHFLRFFRNHGLLNVVQRPTWRVIAGGSARYVDKLIAPIVDRVRFGTPVLDVHRDANSVTLGLQDGTEARFDEVILATHSDQALRMLASPTEAEKEILGAMTYQPNEVVLHTDTTLLPNHRRAWASWNYRLRAGDTKRSTLTYNMNMLQGLESDTTYCVTLNDTASIDPDKILGRFVYDHPVYTAAALDAQRRWRSISGEQRTHYCGAYWGYGFHEDGVKSALAVCKYFGQSLR